MSDFTLKIHVIEITKGEIANLIRGHMVINGKKFRFTAVAYGRYGGQNISPDFSSTSVNRLRKMGVDNEVVKSEVQQKLMMGDFTISKKVTGDHPPDIDEPIP